MKPVHIGLFLALTTLWVASGCETGQLPDDASAEETLSEDMASPADEARARLEANEGGQILLRAIEAHGGLDTWYNTPTSSYTWEYSNVDMNFRFKSHLVADNRTRQVYHDLLEVGTVDEMQPVDGAFAWDGEKAWIHPDTLSQPNPRFWATTGYYFESIPFILSDPGLQYERLPDEELDGEMYDLVRVSYDSGVGDSPGDMYLLYVDKETSVVRAIRYTVTYGMSKDDAVARDQRETLFYYNDYTTVDGLTVATYFDGYHFVDGEIAAPKNKAWATDISFSEPFDPAKLTMPAEARVQPMPQAAE